MVIAADAIALIVVKIDYSPATPSALLVVIDEAHRPVSVVWNANGDRNCTLPHLYDCLAGLPVGIAALHGSNVSGEVGVTGVDFGQRSRGGG